MALDKFNSSQIGSSLNAWLPFLFYSMLSLALMAVDNRFSISRVIRSQTSELASPIWWLASRPYTLWQSAEQAFNTNQSLHAQVKRYEKQTLLANLALQQMSVVQSENAELRALLAAKQRTIPTARMVELININPDPALKRFVIDKGARQQVKIGQVVIDAYGLVGQVIEVYSNKSLVINITDADHALPVMVARSGFRSILFGQGNDRTLSLANLTPSDDIKVGDALLTSGIGERFPPGIPVGVVRAFKQDPALTFLSAQVAPFSRLGYGRHLLLLDYYTPPLASEVVALKPSAQVAQPVQAERKP